MAKKCPEEAFRNLPTVENMDLYSNSTLCSTVLLFFLNFKFLKILLFFYKYIKQITKKKDNTQGFKQSKIKIKNKNTCFRRCGPNDLKHGCHKIGVSSKSDW